MMGLVYYADDPDKRVFRKVYLVPGETWVEFTNPKHVIEGVDPSRKAVLVLVDDNSEAARAPMTGVP